MNLIKVNNKQAVFARCFIKKVFLGISQNSQGLFLQADFSTEHLW